MEGIQLTQILFQIVNFSAIVGILSFLLYRPILKILEERAQRVEEAQKAAEETISQKAKISSQSDEIIKSAQAQAAVILEEAKEAGKKTKADLLAQAKTSAEAELVKLKENWLQEKKQYQAEMKQEFVSAVRATAEKAMNAELDSKKHDKLINEGLEQLLKVI